MDEMNTQAYVGNEDENAEANQNSGQFILNELANKFNFNDTQLEMLDSMTRLIDEKARYWDEMRSVFENAVELSKIDGKIWRACKDYYHYRGRAWDYSEGEDKAPLKKIKGEKFPDRVSGPFIKVLDIILNLATMDDLQLLDPYINALAAYGIKLDLSEVERKVKPEDYDQVMATTSDLQTHICELADVVNDMKPNFADAAICSKNSFGKIKNVWPRLTKGKNCQKTLSNMFISSSTDVGFSAAASKLNQDNID